MLITCSIPQESDFEKRIDLFVIIICMSMLPACMYVHHVPGAIGGRKISDPWNWSYEMVVRHVGTGH